MPPVESRYRRRIHHGDSDVHDLKLLTRKPTRIRLDDLSYLWGGSIDKNNYLALFLLYNKPSFSFLSIDTQLADDGSPGLIFIPSEKVGCAPLFSPISGKICASIIVTGYMDEDVAELLPLVGDHLNINFSTRLQLPYRTSIQPPIYFEAAKFIDQYLRAKKQHWQKFISTAKVESSPTASTQWSKYAAKSYDPQNVLKFPNKKNLLSSNHTEWQELNYVLKLCLDKLDSAQTPRQAKHAYNLKIEELRRTADIVHAKKTTSLHIHAADPHEIKILKEIGNRVLNSVSCEYRAWYVDFSKLFECYVQYIFDGVAKQLGGYSYSNLKFSISGAQRNWALSYLEPDVLLRKGNLVIVADAKYKMHMNNSRAESVDILKETFRHDVHQILAYSSFETGVQKTSLIVYPCKRFTSIHQIIHNPIIASSNDLFLVGIPWGQCMDGNQTLSIDQKNALAINGIRAIIEQHTKIVEE